MRPAIWPREAHRMMVLDAAHTTLTHAHIEHLPSLVRAGDLVVVNDAATIPASLRGTTARGEPVELRLAGATEDEHGVVRGALRRRRLAHAHGASTRASERHGR